MPCSGSSRSVSETDTRHAAVFCKSAGISGHLFRGRGRYIFSRMLTYIKYESMEV